ncbi:UNVERIFIED_CONTAM: hypothetical protein HDU68_005641, partial [Siphonaria sp. JEL0065]
AIYDSSTNYCQFVADGDLEAYKYTAVSTAVTLIPPLPDLRALSNTYSGTFCPFTPAAAPTFPVSSPVSTLTFSGTSRNSGSGHMLLQLATSDFDECQTKCVADLGCVVAVYSDGSGYCVTYSGDYQFLSVANNENMVFSFDGRFYTKTPTSTTHATLGGIEVSIQSNLGCYVVTSEDNCAEICNSLANCLAATFDSDSMHCQLATHDDVQNYYSLGAPSYILLLPPQKSRVVSNVQGSTACPVAAPSSSSAAGVTTAVITTANGVTSTVSSTNFVRSSLATTAANPTSAVHSISSTSANGANPTSTSSASYIRTSSFPVNNNNGNPSTTSANFAPSSSTSGGTIPTSSGHATTLSLTNNANPSTSSTNGAVSSVSNDSQNPAATATSGGSGMSSSGTLTSGATSTPRTARWLTIPGVNLATSVGIASEYGYYTDDDCIARCKEITDCVGAVFWTGTGTCYTYSSISTGISVDLVRNVECPPGTIFTGINFSGNVISSASSTDYSDCNSQCAAVESCVAAVYTLNNNMCSLRSGFTNGNAVDDFLAVIIARQEVLQVTVTSSVVQTLTTSATFTTTAAVIRPLGPWLTVPGLEFTTAQLIRHQVGTTET